MPITEEQVQSPLSADLQAILRYLSCGFRSQCGAASLSGA
jgi:hypothetical protein